MASTEWSNEDIDRIFESVSAAIFDGEPIANVVTAIRDANAASVWPDELLEDVLDAEVIGDN